MPRDNSFLGAAFRIGSENYKDFLKLSEEYGDVYSLYIGSRLTVVLNGTDAIHEALVKNSTVFAGRPDLLTMEKAGYGGRGIINSTYGKKWQVKIKILKLIYFSLNCKLLFIGHGTEKILQAILHIG
jgi:hypothetical protein